VAVVSLGWALPCDLATMIPSDTRMATAAVSMTLRIVIPLSGSKSPIVGACGR
jgi:hypothetical protein